MFKNMINKAKCLHLDLCQRYGAFKVAPSQGQIQLVLFGVGMTLISAGITHGAMAQAAPTLLANHTANFNDIRVSEAVATILTMIEGSFGALVMVVSGIAAILSSAFGQYKAALGCLVVAVGSFILRSVMSTFFNTDSLNDISED